MTWLLALFAFFIPLTDPTRAVLGGGSVAELLLVVLTLLAAWKLLAVTSRPRGSLLLALSLVFIALALASLTWNAGEPFSDVAPAWNDSVRPIEYALAFVSLRTLLSTGARRRAFVLGMWAGCAVAAASAFLHLALGPNAGPFSAWGPHWTVWDASKEFRVHGSFGNPLNLSGYAATLLGVSLSIAGLSVERRRRLIFGGTAVLLCVVLAATGSKIAVVAFLVAMLLSWNRSLAPLMVAIVLVVAASGATRVLAERSSSATNTGVSVLQRALVYQSAIHMIADHPWLGVGPGRFGVFYTREYQLPGSSKDPESLTAENMFLQQASELGIPAALAMLALLALAIGQGFRYSSTPTEETIGLGPRALSTGLCCYVVVGLVQSMSSADISLFFFSLLALGDRLVLAARSAPVAAVVARALPGAVPPGSPA